VRCHPTQKRFGRRELGAHTNHRHHHPPPFPKGSKQDAPRGASAAAAGRRRGRADGRPSLGRERAGGGAQQHRRGGGGGARGCRCCCCCCPSSSFRRGRRARPPALGREAARVPERPAARPRRWRGPADRRAAGAVRQADCEPCVAALARDPPRPSPDAPPCPSPLPTTQPTQTNSVAGYFQLNRTYDAHMFYLYYAPRHPSGRRLTDAEARAAPVVLWMTGALLLVAGGGGTETPPRPPLFSPPPAGTEREGVEGAILGSSLFPSLKNNNNKNPQNPRNTTNHNRRPRLLLRDRRALRERTLHPHPQPYPP
jgi:hypothetical protein